MSHTHIPHNLLPAEDTAAVAAAKQQQDDTGRAIRRSLNKTGRYTRQPDNNEESQRALDQDGVGYSMTGLVAQMREQGNFWQQGDVTVKLAKAYGYCWGVERAVRMAYEARRAFPGQNIHITNEIIHNPEVNRVRAQLHDIQAMHTDRRVAAPHGLLTLRENLLPQETEHRGHVQCKACILHNLDSPE